MSETNSPVQVNVRVEGRKETIFDGTVMTQGHDVTTESGGTHPADGTNGNEYPFKVPTCTSALDDASKVNPGFTWDGTYSSNLDDYFVTRIGTDVAQQGEYWQLALNFRGADLGGSQMNIQKADSVVWALIKLQQAPAKGLPLLKLKGPRSAVVNVEILVTVIVGEIRQGVQGATVKELGGTGAWISAYQGKVKVTFATSGEKWLKAEFDGIYVRSNVLKVTVSG